jgi:hypothetical protein
LEKLYLNMNTGDFWRFLDIWQRSHEPPPPQSVRACPEGLFEGMQEAANIANHNKGLG